MYVPEIVAFGREAVEMVGAALTVMVSDFVAVTPWESVTVTVKVSLTADALTVPLIMPELDPMVRPAGRMLDVIVQVLGAVPPVATTGWL